MPNPKLNGRFKKIELIDNWKRLNAKIKMPLCALNFLDVGKKIKVGFFSKENTETRCMGWLSSYEHSLNTPGILYTKSSTNPLRTLVHMYV